MSSATASAPSRGAGFLAQLQTQAGALRKPVATKDASAPRLDADFFAAEIEADKHEKYYLDLGLEQWMPLVEELTFETVSVPLSQADAQLLRRCYAALHGPDRVTSPGRRAPGPMKPTLGEEDVAELVALGRRLEPSLAGLGFEADGAFVKLSGRSSKDAPLHTARLRADYVELAAAHRASRPPTPAAAEVANQKLFHLFEAALGLMRVRKVPHALWLLVNSQRVDDDLDVALRHAHRKEGPGAPPGTPRARGARARRPRRGPRSKRAATGQRCSPAAR